MLETKLLPSFCRADGLPPLKLPTVAPLLQNNSSVSVIYASGIPVNGQSYLWAGRAKGKSTSSLWQLVMPPAKLWVLALLRRP